MLTLAYLGRGARLGSRGAVSRRHCPSEVQTTWAGIPWKTQNCPQPHGYDEGHGTLFRTSLQVRGSKGVSRQPLCPRLDVYSQDSHFMGCGFISQGVGVMRTEPMKGNVLSGSWSCRPWFGGSSGGGGRVSQWDWGPRLEHQCQCSLHCQPKCLPG